MRLTWIEYYAPFKRYAWLVIDRAGHDYRQNFEVMLVNERYRIVRRKNSSGWNSSDLGDRLVFWTSVVGAIILIVIL